jgi:hypothetical protein
LDIQGTYTDANIVLSGCVLVAGSGTPLWHDARWITDGGFARINVHDSYLSGSIELKDNNQNYTSRKSGISFERCYMQSPDSIIYTAIGTSSYPNLSFEDCINGDDQFIFPDLTIAKYAGSGNHAVPHLMPYKSMLISWKAAANDILEYDAESLFKIPTYGQLVNIDTIVVNVKDRTSGADGTSNKAIKIYSDAGMTVLIGTASIAAGTSTSTEQYPIVFSSSKIVSEGIYIKITIGDTGTTYGIMHGTISLRYHSI